MSRLTRKGLWSDPAESARRPVAALLAGLFLVGVGGEAYAVHLPVSGEPSAAAHPASHRTPDSSETTSHDRPHEPLRCPCIGLCHGATAAPHPSAPFTLPRRLHETVSVAAERPATVPRARWAPFLLPYPNGPPTA